MNVVSLRAYAHQLCGGILSFAVDPGLSTATPVLADGTGNGGSFELVAQRTGESSESSERQDPNSAGNISASGRVEGLEPSGQATEEHLIHTQIFKGYAHTLPPSDQVLKSKDILRLILLSLKVSFAESEDWKAAFVSIIRVSRPFFWAGIGPLWDTMTSIGPALKLLPWHGNSEYKGLGSYRYIGEPAEWVRFLLYTPLIRKLELKLQPGSDDFTGPHWITELLYLPARPLLFPYISSITISPEVLASLPLLPLLVNTSLKSLDITACDDDDWHEEAADDNVQANFPLIHCAAQYLQLFRYRGPARPTFFRRLTLLKSITSLDLEWVNTVDSSDLLCLSDLPQLRTLNLTSSEPISLLQAGSRSPEGAVGWPAIRVLKIIGVEMMQDILTRFQHQHAQVGDLHLVMTRVDKPALVQATLAFYLRCHVKLESIRMRILLPWEQQDPWPTTATIGISNRSDLDIEANARLCFAAASSIKTATFEWIPQSLWRFMSSALQTSIGGWERLTSLTFRIQPTAFNVFTVESNTSSTGSSISPGLSFLANTIWLECPLLEFLEFHFDKAEILNENLSRAIEDVKSQASPDLYPNGHPLRGLVINTDVTDVDENIGLTLNPDKKIEVVAFLKQLFPRLTLDGLRGTPVDLWCDMGTWLHTYRKLKVKALQSTGF